MTLSDFNDKAHSRLEIAETAVRKRGGATRFRKLAAEGADALDESAPARPAERMLAHLNIAACLAVAAQATDDAHQRWDDAIQAVEHLDAACDRATAAPPILEARVLYRASSLLAHWERLAEVDTSERLPVLTARIGELLGQMAQLRNEGVRDLVTARELLRLSGLHPDRRDRLRSAASEEAASALTAFAESGEDALASQARRTLADAST